MYRYHIKKPTVKAAVNEWILNNQKYIISHITNEFFRINIPDKNGNKFLLKIYVIDLQIDMVWPISQVGLLKSGNKRKFIDE